MGVDHELHSSAERGWPLLTIDTETVLLQAVVAQPGDTMRQPAQLPVQLLPVQSRAFRVRAIHADGIHSGGSPILLRPG